VVALSFTLERPVQLLHIAAVADKGSEDRCNGEDWISIVNDGAVALDLNGHMLTDDKGLDSEEAYTFASDASIKAGETIVLCKGDDGSFEFGVGAADRMTLWDGQGNPVDATTLGGDGVFNKVWAFSASESRWGYTIIGNGPLPVCMNGKVEVGEECDTGTPTAECSAKCKANAAAFFFGDDTIPEVTIVVTQKVYNTMKSCSRNEYLSANRPSKCDYQNAVCSIKYDSPSGKHFAQDLVCEVRRKGHGSWRDMSSHPSFRMKLDTAWWGMKKFTFNNMSVLTRAHTHGCRGSGSRQGTAHD